MLVLDVEVKGVLEATYHCRGISPLLEVDWMEVVECRTLEVGKKWPVDEVPG